MTKSHSSRRSTRSSRHMAPSNRLRGRRTSRNSLVSPRTRSRPHRAGAPPPVRFLDTNVFIRYLTRDDEKKAAACFELFQHVGRGEEQVTTCEAIVTEVVYVLSSRGSYGLNHAEIRAR